ncbi:MAG: putative metal-dependent hydrolase, partial [Saprospiraceae bacterium]|nr:putative metal-dependent hydrolase [Saprospiraceae bacterium]
MRTLQELKYPIGQFTYGQSYTFDETRKNIKSIARTPKQLKKLLKKANNAQLESTYRKGGWTIRQIVNHLVDSHVNAYVRMKLAVTENAPIIKPYEENLWANTEDGKSGSVKSAIKLLSALHRRWVEFMESLSEEELERVYFHPANQRHVPLTESIALYSWHSRHHLAHIRIALN